MQWIGGRTHASFPMEDTSRVGEARRHAAVLSDQAGLDDTAAGELAIIVTELGNNLVRHAREGRLLMAAHGGSGEVEVVAIDNGPGIPDVGKSMSDGFSTGGTPGTGLGAVRRLARDFEMHSVIGQGTVVVARVRAEGAVGDSRIRVGGIALTAPGETVCGDSWGAWVGDEAVTLMLADGLGHGPAANEASQTAIEVLREDAAQEPKALLEETHSRLRTTRGAAVSILRMDARAGDVRYCGAGNVVARVVSGASDRTLLTQHGTAGLQMRRVEEASVPWPPHAVLIAHSDGIDTRWTAKDVSPLLARDPVVIAAVLLRHLRGRDDATVVVAQRRDWT